MRNIDLQYFWILIDLTHISFMTSFVLFLPSRPVTVSYHPISISSFVSDDRFLSSYLYIFIRIWWPFPIILSLYLSSYLMTVSYHPISISSFVSDDRFLSSYLYIFLRIQWPFSTPPWLPVLFTLSSLCLWRQLRIEWLSRSQMQ